MEKAGRHGDDSMALMSQRIFRTSLLAFLVVGGCASYNLIEDTQKESKERVVTFKISPEQAYDFAVKAAVDPITKEFPQVFGHHPFIVGRWYLFSKPEYFEVNLTGFYVNGDDGRVVYINERADQVAHGERNR